MSNIRELLIQAKELLQDDEQALAYVMGAYKCDLPESSCVQSGLLIATDKRLVFYVRQGIKRYLQEYPYSTISSLELIPSLTGYTISFFSSRIPVQFQWINQGDIDHLVAVIKRNLDHKAEDLAAADDVELIVKLAELKEAGILTQEEFEQKKKMVMGFSEE